MSVQSTVEKYKGFVKIVHFKIIEYNDLLHYEVQHLNYCGPLLHILYKENLLLQRGLAREGGHGDLQHL